MMQIYSAIKSRSEMLLLLLLLKLEQIIWFCSIAVIRPAFGYAADSFSEREWLPCCLRPVFILLAKVHADSGRELARKELLLGSLRSMSEDGHCTARNRRKPVTRAFTWCRVAQGTPWAVFLFYSYLQSMSLASPTRRCLGL